MIREAMMIEDEANIGVALCITAAPRVSRVDYKPTVRWGKPAASM